jgi:hypothetical protein
MMMIHSFIQLGSTRPSGGSQKRNSLSKDILDFLLSADPAVDSANNSFVPLSKSWEVHARRGNSRHTMKALRNSFLLRKDYYGFGFKRMLIVKIDNYIQ